VFSRVVKLYLLQDQCLCAILPVDSTRLLSCFFKRMLFAFQQPVKHKHSIMLFVFLVMVGKMVNEVLEKVWKGAVMVQSRYYPSYWPSVYSIPAMPACSMYNVCGFSFTVTCFDHSVLSSVWLIIAHSYEVLSWR